MSKFEFPKNNNCLESALEALSKDQLIRLLSCMILDCPNTEKVPMSIFIVNQLISLIQNTLVDF